MYEGTNHMEDLQKVHYDKPERAVSTCIVMSTPVFSDELSS